MTVLLEYSGSIAALTLDSPQNRNAITAEIATRLISLITTLESTAHTRAVVLAGSGGTFCAGGDLRSMPPESPEAARSRLEIYAELISRIRKSRLPFVCAIEGTAAGIGVSLALACDVIVASRKSRLLLPFSKLGLFPDGNLVPSLAERVGAGKAKMLLLLAHPISAVEAAQLSLVDQITDADCLTSVTFQIAKDLSERAPKSIELIKRRFANGLLGEAISKEFEIEAQSRLYFSADFAAGKAAFFARTKPTFTNR